MLYELSNYTNLGYLGIIMFISNKPLFVNLYYFKSIQIKFDIFWGRLHYFYICVRRVDVQRISKKNQNK